MLITLAWITKREEQNKHCGESGDWCLLIPIDSLFLPRNDYGYLHVRFSKYHIYIYIYV